MSVVLGSFGLVSLAFGECAQHSVQQMVGTGRISGQVAGLRRFPVEVPSSPPHHR